MFKFPDAVLEQHSAVLGKTGRGKTNTAKLLIEQAYDREARVCILDPIKSDWWGLTAGSDGKRAGLPFYILGGPHAHVPLHADAGKAIAEVVANGSLRHSIIDMADFEPGGQAHFFKAFAPALLKRMKGVLYLVMEEAHIFAPKERSGVGDENMSVYWAKQVATAGRSKGLRLVLITQRTQALHNALLGSCDTLIAHGMTAPADQEPVVKWLKANLKDKELVRTIENSIAGLKKGEAWLCSGEANLFERVQFPRCRTYDNTGTPTDDTEIADVRTAPVDEARLRSLIGAAIQQAQLQDPKALLAQIDKLQQEMRRLETRAVPVGVHPEEVRHARDQGMQQGLRAANEVIGHKLRAIREELTEADRRIDRVMNETAVMLDGAEAAQRVPVDTFGRVDREPTDFQPSMPVAGLDYRPNSNMPPGEAKILAAAIQQNGVTPEQLAVLAGFKRSARNTYISRLTGKGFVERQGDRIVATALGRAALPSVELLPTGRALQAYWLERLPPGEAKILKILMAEHPRKVSREILRERADYQRSALNSYLSRLSSRRLVQSSRQGVAAAAMLME